MVTDDGLNVQKQRDFGGESRVPEMGGWGVETKNGDSDGKSRVSMVKTPQTMRKRAETRRKGGQSHANGTVRFGNGPQSDQSKEPAAVSGLDREASPGFEPGNDGFANRCLTTWLR